MSHDGTQQSVLDRGAGTGAEWSVGVFGPGITQPPAACLKHCLSGESGRAADNGCPLVQALARREGDAASRMEAAPPVCDQGYGVSLLCPQEEESPDVLVLRPVLEGPQGPQMEGAISALQEAAIEKCKLDQENRGLADEVLRSYEQINLIFDVSAEIAVLNDAEEVRRKLLVKLQHLFDADAVYFVATTGEAREVLRSGRLRSGWRSPPGEEVRSDPHAQEIQLPPEYPVVLGRLQKSRRVLVSAVEAHHDRTGHGTSLWGPLTSGDSSFDVVGIVRRRAPFVAGDMLVLDSALTYGSNILSNLRLVEQLKRTSFEAVRALVNAIDQKDNYTYGHSERVGFLAKITGQYMGMPARHLQELEWAGLLHDVGKIGIPEHVLNKPGRLSDEEFALIKEHPSRSFEVLRPVASLEPVLDAVLYHHENPDGSGYPCGLKGDEIPLMARIIHVVDVFDALTSTRSYRQAYNVDRAIEILRKDAGTKLDAQIVDQFLKAWALLPKSHPEQLKRWFGSEQEGEA